MPRPLLTPPSFKAALAEQVRKTATRSRRDETFVRQDLLMDRYLARLGAVAGERLTLRGGRALDLRLGHTRNVRDPEVTLDAPDAAVLDVLVAATRQDLGDYFVFTVREVLDPPNHIAEGMRVPIQRYRLDARLAGVPWGDPFGLDVYRPEPGAGAAERRPGSEILSFGGVARSDHRVLSMASHVADAIHFYTLGQPTRHPRVWDLPDLAQLATTGPVSGDEVQEAIRLLFAHRGTHTPPDKVPPFPAAWVPHAERLMRDERIPWRNVDELVDLAGTFIGPILAGGRGTWNPGTWRWEA